MGKALMNEPKFLNAQPTLRVANVEASYTFYAKLGRDFTIEDPDGNLVTLSQILPSSRERERAPTESPTEPGSTS